MSAIKTAISLDASLFEQVEKTSREMNISRSRLVALALESFLHHRENRTLIEQINRAVADGQTDAERSALDAARRHHRVLASVEPY